MDKNNHTILTELIGRVHLLNPSQLQQITDECEIKPFHKQQHITETGKKDLNEYFLLDGIVHRYTLQERGEFITTGFYKGPSIITPNFARTSDQKSIFSLQALVPSVFAIIPVDKLDELRTSTPEIRRWGQRVVEQELKNAFIHETGFRSSNAKERLLRLRNEYPNLENLVPHTCIASYIGVTPVSFSRLRKELARV
jgi:CRP-like cAMP-binding protein